MTDTPIVKSKRKSNKISIKCKIKGCEREHKHNGYCCRHYAQIKRTGEIFGNLKRTLLDPNLFIIEGDICRIVLFDIRGWKRGVTIIDTEDYEKCKIHKWHLNKWGYVFTKINGKSKSIHSYILNSDKVDHKDHDTLNNRKANLRECTYSQNCINRFPIKKTSKYKGVSFAKRNNKWCASISANNVKKWLGYFDDEIEAAKAFDRNAIKMQGEFAYLNFKEETI